MGAYRALVVSKNSDDTILRDIAIKNSEDLDTGDILIKVKYSSLNYYDALIASGDKNLLVKYPITPGMDAVGTVVESSSEHFKKGDEVVVTGCGLGQKFDGGYGQYIKVPANIVFFIPTGLTMKDCMTIGTDGFAAALAVMEIIASGSLNKNDRIAVTGPLNGIGVLALAILSNLNYNVTAISDIDQDSENYLEKLGAKNIIPINVFLDKKKVNSKDNTFSAGIDTLGGDVLSVLLSSIDKNGSVALCNMIGSNELKVSINPFIFKGINILGVDSINCDLTLRSQVWNMMSGEWYLKVLSWLRTEISITEINSYINSVLENKIKGRILINHEL